MIVIENVAHNSAPVSLSLEGVGIHGLLFASAADKAEWMDLLAGCDVPQKGSILLQRKDSQLPVHTQKKHVGYVPSELALYGDMTVSELLEFVGEAKGISPDKRVRQIKEAVELMGLQKTEKRLIASLSVAVCRRIAFAQALLGNPSVILVDDPFADTNAEQRRDMEDLLQMLGRHKPIVIGSLSADILPLCSDVGVIDHSGVRFFGEASQLLESLANAETKSVSDTQTAARLSVADYFGFHTLNEEDAQ